MKVEVWHIYSPVVGRRVRIKFIVCGEIILKILVMIVLLWFES